MLEYHLQSLTSRNQEHDFEEFARHLAEKELCPNLIPHTGPTGGGDSKVDSETYPVSDQLSLAWFSGVGREAASERWAFAFSAKKVWRSKVQSDVKKIASVQRGYTKAFFLTNQFVPDRTRALVEDALRKKYKLDVRILDRNWILDRVFAGRHEEMAVRELRIATIKPFRIRKGPLDTEREQDLEDAENRVLEFTREGRLGVTLVEASIQTALLARGLDRPRTEIDGRFDRAERLADQYGTHAQQLECAYQRAWTTFWWFEDFTTFSKLYTDVENHASSSDNPYDLERLTNLWFILNASAERGDIPAASADLERRTTTLIAALERLAREEGRPSAALQAEALLIKVRLMSDPSGASDALPQLEEVVRRSEGLVGFPLEPLAELLTELGNVLGDRPEYEKLYDTLIEVTTKRSGEVHAARMLLKRGAQQLDAKKPYEAIRSLGRALRKLYKHESRQDLVRALYLCGSAYEQVGLFWAARGTLLIAAWIATSEFSTYGEITLLQAACYQRLKWVELRLGRVPQALEWYELDRMIRNILVSNGHDREQLFADELAFDAGLGVLFLNTDIGNLSTLVDLPAALERLDLFRAAIALLFALGHEERVREELGEVVPQEEFLAFFSQWRQQPISRDLPTAPTPSEERRTVLTSRVLGCRIELDVDYAFPALELGESLLAATESFLATGLEHRLIGREPSLQIDVRKSDFAEMPFEFTSADRDGLPYFEVRCASFASDNITLGAQGAIKERLFELVANVVGRMVFVGDPEKTLRPLFEEELVLERALDFTSSFVVTTNILGPHPRNRLSMWSEPGDRRYPLLRDQAWYTGAVAQPPEISPKEQPLKFGKGDPPEELRGMHQTRHDQVRTISLIRESLWAKARWSATAFIVDLSNQLPPILAPIFQDEQAARSIFSLWHRELGPIDEKGLLRITIVRGISRTNPIAYRVTIGTNMEALEIQPEEITVFLSRSNTMNPTTSENLDRFLRSQAAVGEYLIAPAVQGPGNQPDLLSELSILKREISVRDAWQIGRHDPDVMGVSDDDEPIIPPGVTDAPVTELIDWLRGKDQPSKYLAGSCGSDSTLSV